ncbi:MAG: hypothetical protein Q7S22_00520 [Candidatus Micrarchaeota archaeon]|nr:hypothetical protein [Candidatus Micrarchaeota archaeon]
MRLLIISFFILIILFGCTGQPSATNDTKTTVSSDNTTTKVDDITPVIPKNDSEIITSDILKYSLPCEPSKDGTIETIGIETKTFLGKKYDVCHTRTRMANPPQGGTGTPKLIGQDTWGYLDIGGASEIPIFSYDYVLYTDNYFEGGVTYQKKDGLTCVSYNYGPAPKNIEAYVEADFKCQ